MKDSAERSESEQFLKLLHENPGFQEIWDLSGTVHVGQKLSQRDVESDLEALLGKLGIDGSGKTSSTQNQSLTLLKRPFTTFLAAALLLLAIGTGYFIVPNQTVVPYGETAMITLPDGSTVELNSGSTLEYSRLFGLLNRSVTLNGEGYFDVKKNDRPFQIESNQVFTEVLGTSFNIKSWNGTNDPFTENASIPGQTEVTVTNGKVSVKAGGRVIQLEQGESGAWNPDAMLMSGPDTGHLTHALAWRNNALSFQNERLMDIFRTLERRFDVKITWSKDVEHLAVNRMTAYYSAPLHLDRILKDISTVKSLHFSRSSEGYHIQTGTVNH